MPRTKIVCTIGPASRSPETLTRLVDAGMDVARLNFSHGNHAEHAAVIQALRAIAGRAGRPIAILQDLSGIKIRIGAIADGTVRLEPGSVFTLTTRDVPGDANEVSVGFPDLPRCVKPGDRLLLADGALSPAAFYQAWFLPVYAYFARRTAHAALAEDLTADTFERLVSALPTLRADGGDHSSVRAWVYRAAANVFINALRGSGRRKTREDAWNVNWQPDSEGRAELESSLALGQAMARLRPEDQDLLGLKYWDGLTAAEIALVRGCEAREVYTAVERCLRALRRQLVDDKTSAAEAPIRRPEEKMEAHGVNA